MRLRLRCGNLQTCTFKSLQNRTVVISETSLLYIHRPRVYYCVFIYLFNWICISCKLNRVSKERDLD